MQLHSAHCTMQLHSTNSWHKVIILNQLMAQRHYTQPTHGPTPLHSTNPWHTAATLNQLRAQRQYTATKLINSPMEQHSHLNQHNYAQHRDYYTQLSQHLAQATLLHSPNSTSSTTLYSHNTAQPALRVVLHSTHTTLLNLLYE